MTTNYIEIKRPKFSHTKYKSLDDISPIINFIKEVDNIIHCSLEKDCDAKTVKSIMNEYRKSVLYLERAKTWYQSYGSDGDGVVAKIIAYEDGWF